MNELNANADRKSLAFNGWEFQFFCGQLQNPLVMTYDDSVPQFECFSYWGLELGVFLQYTYQLLIIRSVSEGTRKEITKGIYFQLTDFQAVF